MGRKFTRDLKNDAYYEMRIERELDKLRRELIKPKKQEDQPFKMRKANRKHKNSRQY